MKKVLELVFSLFIIFYQLLIIFLIGYSYIFNTGFLQNKLKETNYYEEAHKNIIKHFNEISANDNIQNVLSEIIDVDVVEKDINKIIKSIIDDEDIYDKIKNSINKEIKDALENNLNSNYDQNSLIKLTDELSKSYMTDLYPVKELKTIYIWQTSKFNVFIIIFLIIILILFILLSSIVSKKRPLMILYRSNYCVSAILLFIFVIYKMSKLNDLFYANAYFSLYIQSIISSFMNLLLIFSLAILVFTIILECCIIKNTDLTKKSLF